MINQENHDESGKTENNKMTKLYKYFLAAVAALTLAACDKEDAEPKAGRDYPSFSATIEGHDTRASETSWDADDKIGIYGGGATNISHTHQGNGSFTVTNAKEQITFTDNSEVEFTAYYPYGTPYSNSDYPGKIATYAKKNITQKPADQKTFDYLWAKATKGSKANPDVKFNFTHRMSKITLVFESDEIDVSKITAYSVSGLFLRGTFDPLTGECKTTTTSTNSASVTVSNFGSGKVADGIPAPPIIIFPQELNSNPVTLSVTATAAGIGTITGSLNFPDGKLKSGDEYRFNIKVSKTGLSLGEATIKPWNPENLGEKEAS